MDHVDPHALGRQGPVEVLGPVAVAHVDARVGVELAAPPRLVVEQDGGVVAGGAAGRLLGRVEHPGQLDDLAPLPGVGAGVGEEPRVELLRPGPRGAPLEEQHRVGAVRDVRQAVADHLAGHLGAVAGLPVDRARGVLHQQPRTAVGRAAGEVGAERQLAVAAVLRPDEVVVVGHDVELTPPAQVVHGGCLPHDHEVGRHRHPGGEPVQHVALDDEVVEQLVGGEAREVELLGGVGVGGRHAWRQHLLEVVVALGPERRAPRVVEPRHVVVVPAAQPRAERRRAGVAVAAGVVAAELVGHVPQGERRVVAVALGHPGAQLQGVLAVDR